MIHRCTKNNTVRVFVCLLVCLGLLASPFASGQDALAANSGAASQSEKVLVAVNAVWKYLDNGSDQGTAWKNPDFDDSSWKSGPAELGYGDGDEATVVGFGPDKKNKYITTYFRHSFSLNNAQDYTALRLNLKRDDGAVVYLNGKEVFRANLPSGPVGYKTLADEAKSGSDQVDLDPKLLVNGRNVLAIEIHQSKADSSDISMRAELTGKENPPPPPTPLPTQAPSLAPSSTPAPATNEVSGSQPTAAPVVVQATSSILIAKDAVWKYLDNGSNQGTAWKNPDFDDATWKSGPAELGYGDGDEATVVGYGPNSQRKYITTYFRHGFIIADAASIGGLSYTLKRDDGAVIYLNGFEVARWNMPAGTITHTTRASSEIGEQEQGTIDPRLLENGRNVIAVEIHQVSDSSSDISMVFELTGLSGAPSAPTAAPTATAVPSPTPQPTTQPVSDGTLIAKNAVWKYLDNGSNQGTLWRAPSFSDSTWKSGPAKLGYGDGDEATVVSFGSNESSKYITTYFRHNFSLSDLSGLAGLSLTMRRDDGAVVYLNGTEVFRSNMPSGTISYTTLAASSSSVDVQAYLDPKLLVSGKNVVAVEIHQVKASSTDIGFWLELKGSATVPIAPVTQPTAQPTVQPTSAPSTPPTVPLSSGNSWYVAPNGSSSGSGSSSSPWNLTTALNHPSAVKPGDTIWLRGGKYGSGGSQVFKSNLKGVSGSPITLRAVPGERATIDGAVEVYGAYVTFWGLEVMNSDTDRVSSSSSSSPSDVARQGGFQVFAPYTNFINNIVHDTKSGFGLWVESVNTVMYGNVVYNNGWDGSDRGHGHGVYAQNNTGTKQILDNIVFANFGGYAMHMYTENGYLHGFNFDGNVTIGNTWLVGGGQPASRITMTNNHLWESKARLGYSAQNQDITVKNNVMGISSNNAIDMKYWKTVTFSGNTIWSSSQKGVCYYKPSSMGSYSWNSNAYASTNSSPFMVGSSSYSFSEWKSSTGFDGSSSAQSGSLTGTRIIVRANRYEAKRGHIIVYNWDQKDSVAVDISSLGLKAGDTYILRNAQNYYADAITGTYNGSPITVAMKGWSLAKPIGWGSALQPMSFPRFGVFVLEGK